MRIIKQVLVTWSRLEYVTNLNYFVSTTTVPMATNFYSIVTNFEQLLAMFLHPLVYPLVTWSCKIIWQIKNIFSLLPQCLWPPQCLWLTLHQTGQGWLTMRGFCPQSHMNLESHVKKQKTYLDYHNAYGHKTLQEASIHNVTWPYTQAVLQDRVTN